MIDVSETIRVLGSANTSRPLPESVRALSHLIGQSGASTDWDDYSDEFWARVLRDREVLGIISMYAPVMFTVREKVTAPDGFAAHDVKGFDTECLTASREVLIEAFGARASGPEINPELFSLSDLWFISV